ncbi:MAG: inositol-3-phosphate synthase [Planctomycetales bacterium]|nr:inositol-3-phosphate synthase [Planctomycetales bacterium]
MPTSRVGLWIIGARGGVAVTTITGLIAQQLGLADTTGLVTALPPLCDLPLPAWTDFVVGGHEIRAGSLVSELQRLHHDSRVIDAEVVAAATPQLEAIDREIQPGVLWNVGSRIESLADAPGEQPATATAAVEQIRQDLQDFLRRHELETAVVVNLASTEALPPESAWPQTVEEVDRQLAAADCPLPASSLYAIAAIDLGLPYVNFTPSLGAAPAGIDQRARLRGTCHAGRDGKTGETLLKSVLAPMFAARHLEVMSWVGHNIFGNLDGRVLDDPANKATKLKSKDALLGDILGYAPQTHISIEHIGSLGDWKTAWDHIHFRGFLGTPMTMQFTWQGCDSLLAAPLVLDLARLTTHARRRGDLGALAPLASFFKSPLGATSQVFSDQVRTLHEWAALG